MVYSKHTLEKVGRIEPRVVAILSTKVDKSKDHYILCLYYIIISIHPVTYCFCVHFQAATGIANLTCAAMQAEGLSAQQARDRIYMADVGGLLCPSRPGGLPGGPADAFSKDQAPEKDLEKLVERIKPSCLIGE